MPIKTVDGDTANEGEEIWAIDFYGVFFPRKYIVAKYSKNPSERLYWHDKNLCQQQCDLMNKDKI